MWPVPALLLIVIGSCIWLWRGRLLKDRLWWSAWLVPVIAAAVLAFLVSEDVTTQKLLARLLMPAGMLWLFLLAATLYFIRLGSWAAAGVVFAVTIFYSLAGNAWVGAWLIHKLEEQSPPFDWKELAELDAVCVLGAGTEIGPNGPQLSSAGDRVFVAARLYLQHKTGKLVCSGSSIPGIDQERDLAAETATLWRALSIPERDIIQLPQPTITKQEIAAYQELINTNGWNRVGLVTSAWHMPRAMRLAKAAGLDLVPLPADYRGDMPPLTLYWLTPCSEGFSRVQTACWEMLGTAVGR